MKVLHIIKTVSLDGDGRLQKWIQSLNEAQITSEVYLVEDANQKEKTKLYGAEITKDKFFLRKFFKRRKATAPKVIEYLIKTLNHISKSQSQILVFHDVQQYLNLFAVIIFQKIIKKKTIIWDLHELPHTYLSKNFISRWFIKFILSNTNILIYTNEERREYILSKFKHREKNYFILNNFPDSKFITSEFSPATKELGNWLDETNHKPYILWMGAAVKGRHFDTVLKAYQNFKDQINLVIMGKIDQQFKEETGQLEASGNIFNKYVSQDEIINYVDNALFSVVLYNSKKPNNKYCEPNRLYQLLSRNIPAITGNNPTMQAIVKECDAGIVLPDDGSDIGNMTEAINLMIQRHSEFRKNLSKINKLEKFNWDKQFSEISKKIKTL